MCRFRMQIFGQDDNALQILSNRRSLHNIEPETNGDTKQNVNGFDERDATRNRLLKSNIYTIVLSIKISHDDDRVNW